MDATTIVLPSPPADTRRPPLPLVAAVVPIIAGVVLWLITGSLFALCFAALGPLMLVASLLDGLRARRRERRRADTEADASWQRAEAELERLHAEELAALRRREPDAAGCLREPPLRGLAEPGVDTRLVLGRGERRSSVQARGGEDDRSRAFRARAERLTDAPVSVPLGGGICIRASRPVAAAVARAIIAQLCMRFPPAQLGLHGPGIAEWSLDSLPHTGRRRAAFRLGVGDGEERADATICIRMPGEDPPDGISTVLDCVVPTRGQARTRDGVNEVCAEALSVQQVRVIGAELAGRADGEDALPDGVRLGELPQSEGGSLPAVIGRGERADLLVDLVEDGPHAIVTGMTGTGKSELLTSWVTAMASTRSPEQVAFVLVDFKGGTAFDPLRTLPHVVAVVTDLDAEGARRGVGSLTAELRRREAALAAAGVRDIRDCAELARLVIVVDEFAALVQDHPDLAAIFTDVAARGRALGMHLVLGTQRAGGIIRDALAANCPLRVSLRVADAADSRLVIGTDAAAELSGGAESRGLAYVRRPRDDDAQLARIALTTETELSMVATRWSGHGAQLSPWLPPLPDRIPLPDEREEGVRLLGLADEPEHQRQPWVRLSPGDGLAVIGGPGAGKSAVIDVIAAQQPDAVVVPGDPEQAWDAVAELATGRHGLVLCDDLDLLIGQYPPDHAQLFLSRWESIVRSPAGAIVTASRASGPLTRLIDALPRRALLRLTSKVEHIAAGGEPASFDRDRPAGRAWMDGREVQFCVVHENARGSDALGGAGRAAEPELWRAGTLCAGLVTPAVNATRAVLAGAHPERTVVTVAEATGSGAASEDVIIVGDPEQWRAQWTLLQQVRTAGELVIAAECANELRQLAGVRELPPFAQLHADRAWAVRPGHRPRRVLLA
ncbi:FtsK/SpoIIIE domain-containing protein [Microbacterium sp. NPDC058342]|uniref:FtsK/SpoIIIE domain-containing protein n=1 Tax=Microbacterium sp. NPDC058342 TaxID=3346454 RepID=UPI00365EBC16